MRASRRARHGLGAVAVALAAVAVAAPAGVASAGRVAASRASRSASLVAAPRPVNLASARAVASRHLPPMPAPQALSPRGTAEPSGAGGAATTGCTEPACPLEFTPGGEVEHDPHVYLLLWGPAWTTRASEHRVFEYLNAFYAGLGVEPQDTWSATLSQYGDQSGAPTFGTSVYEGAYVDDSRPPKYPNSFVLEEEADAFAAKLGLTSIDDQVVVAEQSGVCPAGFVACSRTDPDAYCAWHDDGVVPFTNLPYQLDAGQLCGASSVSAPDDGFSIVGGHEYAESITDPDPPLGWIDANGEEVADKCAWTDLGWVALSTGTFAVQPLYSNAAAACVGTTPAVSGEEPTATYLAVATPHPSFGVPTTLDVAVQGDGGGASPTGGVVVSDGTQDCTATLTASSGGYSTGTCALTEPSVGTDALTATYAGHGSALASEVGATLDVGLHPSTVALSVTRARVAYGAEGDERLTVQVAATDDTASGSVTVTSGGRSLCTIALVGEAGSCSLGPTSLRPGVRRLVADYGGDPTVAGSAASDALTVSREASTTSLTATAHVVAAAGLDHLRLRVTVGDADGEVAGQVVVFAGARRVCVAALVDGSGACAPRAGALPVGTYSLVARFLGDRLARPSVSDPVALRVR